MPRRELFARGPVGGRRDELSRYGSCGLIVPTIIAPATSPASCAWRPCTHRRPARSTPSTTSPTWNPSNSSPGSPRTAKPKAKSKVARRLPHHHQRSERHIRRRPTARPPLTTHRPGRMRWSDRAVQRRGSARRPPLGERLPHGPGALPCRRCGGVKGHLPAALPAFACECRWAHREEWPWPLSDDKRRRRPRYEAGSPEHPARRPPTRARRMVGRVPPRSWRQCRTRMALTQWPQMTKTGDVLWNLTDAARRSDRLDGEQLSRRDRKARPTVDAPAAV